MSTSAIGTILDSIRAGLVALPALSDVNVFSAPVAVNDAGLECIGFGRASLTEVELVMGGERLETWTAEGIQIYVHKSWEGSIETTIKAARDRVLAIFAAVETYINDTYTSTLPIVTITAADMSQFFDDPSRICLLEFTLTIQAAKNP